VAISPIAGGAHQEVAADADEEHDRGQEDGQADVLVGRARRRLALLELRVGADVEGLPVEVGHEPQNANDSTT
jgi:hypothetical protein